MTRILKGPHRSYSWSTNNENSKSYDEERHCGVVPNDQTHWFMCFISWVLKLPCFPARACPASLLRTVKCMTSGCFHICLTDTHSLHGSWRDIIITHRRPNYQGPSCADWTYPINNLAKTRLEPRWEPSTCAYTVTVPTETSQQKHLRNEIIPNFCKTVVQWHTVVLSN